MNTLVFGKNNQNESLFFWNLLKKVLPSRLADQLFDLLRFGNRPNGRMTKLNIVDRMVIKNGGKHGSS